MPCKPRTRALSISAPLRSRDPGNHTTKTSSSPRKRHSSKTEYRELPSHKADQKVSYLHDPSQMLPFSLPPWQDMPLLYNQQAILCVKSCIDGDVCVVICGVSFCCSRVVLLVFFTWCRAPGTKIFFNSYILNRQITGRSADESIDFSNWLNLLEKFE